VINADNGKTVVRIAQGTPPAAFANAEKPPAAPFIDQKLLDP
jgi:hypothetical protein